MVKPSRSMTPEFGVTGDIIHENGIPSDLDKAKAIDMYWTW